ncbi:MAG: SPOR domain-containing protein [Rickettsiaceae bacterium]|nr:SPOR domain-containing protein [Rickettsiaceae bacterium]
MRYIIILITLVSAILAGYFFWAEPEGADIPLLSPLRSPYKIEASVEEDLLASEFDKTIYENFSKSKSTQPKVNLAPDPEDPIVLDDSENGGDVFAIGAKDNQNHSENIAPMKVLETKGDLAPRAQKSESQDNSIWDISNDDQSHSVKAKNLNITNLKDNKILPPKKKGDKIHHFIQLGIFRSEHDAKKEWTKIKAENKKLVGSHEFKIKRVRKNDGFYYEALLGPFNEFKSAKFLCGKIVLKKQKCIVVKRNL